MPGKQHPSTDRALSAAPSSKIDTNLDLRRNVYDDKGKELPQDEKEKHTNGDATANGDAATTAMEKASKEPRKQYHCASCSLDCTRLRFHYAKAAPAPVPGVPTPTETKYDVCPNCFLQGRIPNSHHASDFVKMEETAFESIPDRDAPWSSSEMVLLLEGLENYDDNWHQIADHVGTRTREECVQKFIQLGLNDEFDLDEIAGNTSALQPGDPLRIRALNGRDPVSQNENPVLSVVTFLAELADPKVAAAAAGRSVEQVRKDLRAQLEKGFDTEGNLKTSAEKEKASSDKPKTEDSMDVDTASVPAAGGSSSSTQDTVTSLTFGVSASRAGTLLSYEERQMIRVLNACVNSVLEKQEAKNAHFAALESHLLAEKRDVELARQQLFLDRLAFSKRVEEVEEKFRTLGVEGSGEGKAGEKVKFGFSAGERSLVPSSEGGEVKSTEL